MAMIRTTVKGGSGDVGEGRVDQIVYHGPDNEVGKAIRDTCVTIGVALQFAKLVKDWNVDTKPA